MGQARCWLPGRGLILALFSLVTLVVQGQPAWQASVRQPAWYQKVLPTFSDALAQGRRALWPRSASCIDDILS